MGHVFRDKSPYTFPGGVAKIVLHNAARVAEVWLDEWREFYYAMSPGLQLFQFIEQKIFVANDLTKCFNHTISKEAVISIN